MAVVRVERQRRCVYRDELTCPAVSLASYHYGTRELMPMDSRHSFVSSSRWHFVVWDEQTDGLADNAVLTRWTTNDRHRVIHHTQEASSS